MNILSIGINHKTAPVEIRERFVFQQERMSEALKTLHQTKSIQECVILSTCNRMEIYAVVDQLNTGRHYIKSFLSNWFGMNKADFTDYLYIREDDDAVDHLFHVICGLDSMVLGETQILGQVRDAFLFAQEQGTTSNIFNSLFKQAVTLAKKAQTETNIGENAVSVSYAAVELAKKVFGSFKKKSVLIIGAGKMSELTARHLHANGVGSVTVANRTYERASRLAEQFDGNACTMDQLEEALRHTDILISSTGSEDYVLTRSDMDTIMKVRGDRPLFMIDIAVPRDLDPAINDLDNVYLYDIDDLEGIVDANLQERAREAEKIEVMIGEELVAFKNWLQTLGVVPLITSLREKAMNIQAEAVKNIENKLPDLTEKEKRIIRKYTRSMINQLMHDPIVSVKELASEADRDDKLELFTRIFGLEELVEEKKKEEEKKQEASSTSRVKEDNTRRSNQLSPYEVPVR
ncbi:MAG: glutamyl-tRNA reductase [Bacillaceae bacterium]|nr:glutamyl-tRNA reductase [Bacillaceae bacterium]